MEKQYDWDELTPEQKEHFFYPDKLKSMPVKKALEYLAICRDGHDAIFGDYVDFLVILVTKCDIDPDYVFSSDFKEDEEEINKHKLNGKKIDEEELKKKVAEYSKKRQEWLDEEMKKYEESKKMSSEIEGKTEVKSPSTKEKLSKIKQFLIKFKKENTTIETNTKRK